MTAIDYAKFLEPAHVAAAGIRVAEVRELYADGLGIEYRYDVCNGVGRQEAVRFDHDLFLIAGDLAPCPAMRQQQVVSGGDWIHIQFRIGGRGRETIVGSEQSVQAEPHSCVIARYREGMLIERENEPSRHFRAACLYFRPSLMRALIGRSAEHLSANWGWLHEDTDEQSRAATFLMSQSEATAISDLFGCSYRRDIRRNYMYAKALELLMHATGRLCKQTDDDLRPRLSKRDLERLASCREFLAEHLEQQFTLAQLARRIGINRSKLARSFKAIYGLSVQAYWRELRLIRARDLLASGEMSVTEAAAAVGYADISCLTRSFNRRFGNLPKDAKGGARLT